MSPRCPPNHGRRFVSVGIADTKRGFLRRSALAIPAAKMVIAVGELNRASAIATFRMDLRAARQQLVDDIELARHHGPMNGLIGSLVAGVQ